MKKQNGFSLVELLITCAILAIVLVVAVNLVQTQSKNEKAIESAALRVVDISSTGTYFQNIASNAGLSQFFMHLPVKNNGCNETQPCVRRWNNETRKFENKQPSSLASFQNVEFFKDSSADLQLLPIQNSNYKSGSLQLITSEALNYIPPAADDNYYATWPLTNESSTPFVIMMKDSSYFFTLTKELQKASTTSSPYRPSLLKSKEIIPADVNFKNKIFVTYSALNLKHFYVKQNKAFESCQSGSCSSVLKKINAGFSENTIKNEPYYKLELNSLDTSSALFRSFPNLSNISKNNIWPGQNGFPYFPYASFSIINNNGSISDFSPVSDVDIKALSHSSVTEQLITMPINFAFYSLKKSSTKGSNLFDLIETKYFDANSKAETVILKDVEGKVYFARKLGSPTLSLIITK